MLGVLTTVLFAALLAVVKVLSGAVTLILKVVSALSRLALCVLPVTGAVHVLVCFDLAFVFFAGRDPLPDAFPFHPDPTFFLGSMRFLIYQGNAWASMYPQVPEDFMRVLLVAAQILLGAVCLIAGAGVALVPILPLLLAAELAFYVLYGLASGMMPFEQIRGRFFFFFPSSADRHYEKKYRRWIRRHSEEFDNDTFGGGFEDDYDGDYPEDDYDEYDYEEYDYVEEDYRRARPKDIETWGDLSRKGRGRQSGGYGDEYYDPGDGCFGDEDDGYDEYDEADDEVDEGTGSGFDFFAGCKEIGDVEKKYRSLAKIYHPDSQGGDAAAFLEISEQYKRARKRFE